MAYISITFSVLKWLRSRLVSLLQPLNMLLMVVTSLVLRYSMPVMVVRYSIPANQA